MKKKPDQASPLIIIPERSVHEINYIHKKKPLKRPLPPSEETVSRLNAIVKEAPFCFHFQARENDFL